MKEIDSKFVREWTIATTGSSLLIIVVPEVSSLLLGVCQWLVLRRYVNRSWGWILATTVGTYLSALVAITFFIGFIFVDIVLPVSTTMIVALSFLLLLVLLVRSGFQCVALAFIPQQRKCWWWLVSGTFAAVCWLGMVLASLDAVHTAGHVNTFGDMKAEWHWLVLYGVAGAIAGFIEGRLLLKRLSPPAR